MTPKNTYEKTGYQSSPACAERRMLREWYRDELGRCLAGCEQRELEEILPNLFGYHLLQIGSLHDDDLLATSRIIHRVVVDGDSEGSEKIPGLFGRPDAIPVESDSVDVILLPHTLEFENDPHEVLREVDRILVPEGHVVIIGFNPWSLWGLWRLLNRRRRRPPWCGKFRGQMRIKDWLSLLGFDTVATYSYFFRPPLKHSGVMRRLEFMETLGRRWWPILSGGYLIVGKKRVATLTPIKPRWRPRRSLIGAGLVKPTTSRG